MFKVKLAPRSSGDLSGIIMNVRFLNCLTAWTLKGTYTTTRCLKKFPPLNCLILSNLNRFSNILHCWKAYEICQKTHTTLSNSSQACCYTTLGIKSSNFLQIFSRYGSKCKQIAFVHRFNLVHGQVTIIMVALCNRETIYIFILQFLSSFFFFFLA